MTTKRNSENYGTGHDDGLEPLVPLDIGQLDSVNALVSAMSRTAFGGRRLGEAADALEAMIRDEDCFRVVTISGAMTIAKQGLVLCEMIERGWVQAIVATGALMTHGVVEGAGLLHFKHRKSMRDEELFSRGYNRVYDTIELERNLDDTEALLEEVLSAIPEGSTLSSQQILARIGQHLNHNSAGRAILGSAVRHDVPIYVPAFTDSELGLDFAIHNRRLRAEGKTPFSFDPFLDLEDFADRVRAHERLGIFTIGGGVPRNWAQQVAPYLEISADRLGTDEPIRRYRYAVRICPEPDHLGGLSGCSYTEGVSWGKFIPESEGGRQVEVFADATIAWPIIVRAVIERLDSSD
ncbi:MAG TPA: deoxyhypusine synthase [Myxococcales bacterium]|nr:deoxyhypusine synthase [Myxococcales bacterium]HIK83982.1 deoxyhypusine synthase [Myxococcales bacterium]